MKDIHLIYEWLEEFSEESLDKFDEVFDCPVKNGIFTEEDIPGLCDVLFRVEANLEDEDSDNIDWNSKTDILKTILLLIEESKEDKWIEVFVRWSNQFLKLDRPYVRFSKELLVSDFLFGSLKDDERSNRRRQIFFKAIKREVVGYEDLLTGACLYYADRLEKNIWDLPEEKREHCLKVAKKTLYLLETKQDLLSFNECELPADYCVVYEEP